jgi:hypothetical protein
MIWEEQTRLRYMVAIVLVIKGKHYRQRLERGESYHASLNSSV